MDAYLDGWSEFNVAMMGATAALAGLLIVAASVNIAEIVKSASIASRLASGLASLVLALVVSAVGLIPVIPPVVYGIATVALSLAGSVFAVQATRRIYQDVHPENRMRGLKAGLGFLTPGCVFVGGGMLLIGLSGGTVLFAIGAITAIVSGILISWIALVEILR